MVFLFAVENDLHNIVYSQVLATAHMFDSYAYIL